MLSAGGGVQSQDEPGGPVSVGVLTPAADAVTTPVPSPGRKPRRAFVFLTGAAVALVLLAAGALVANTFLASAYSPDRAVLDYLAAQSRGDVDGMWQNAVFQGGEGSYHAFFTKDALAAMMNTPGNRGVSAPRVQSVKQIDGNTALVTLLVNWYSSPGSTVRLRVVKDSARTHFMLYPSWRVVAPTSTINFQYPIQGGDITIDGVTLPDSAGSKVEVISGKHYVAMQGTDILSPWTETVDLSSPSDSVNVQPTDTLLPAALQAARDAVNGAMTNCDAKKSEDCLNHRYTAPNDGNLYFFVAPDGSHVFYTHYEIQLVGDPTSGMKTDFGSQDGELDVSGACTTKLSADTKSFQHNGTFSGKLTWNGSGFDSDVTWTC